VALGMSDASPAPPAAARPVTPVHDWTTALEERGPSPFEPAGHHRVTVVAAHPDDETLGASGCLQALHRAGARITLAVATDGEAAYPALDADGRRALARARRLELSAALRAQGLDDVDVHWLGLPDSGLEGCAAALRTALRPLLADADAYLAPWDGDPHPDHRAVGLAAADVAPVTAHGWAYPIWMWAWLTPDDPAVPWDRARVLRLDAAVLAAKRAAVATFTSQVGPGPDGSPPVLDAAMLAHTARPAELLFRIARTASAPAARFAELYADGADPWRAGSWYERRKRAVVLASLPRERYRRAFEPGCGTGELTRELAARCDAVLASGWSGPHCRTPCPRSRWTSRSSARSSTTSTTPPSRPRWTGP
jgi:LmbE family N-acetylglucosaminyl deacetylase